MRIAFFEVEGWEKGFLTKELGGHELFFSQNTLTADNADQGRGFEIISPFIYSKFTPELINKLPDLKLIATRSTGFDHIDLQAAAGQGIVAANVPFYGENTVAEHAFALILALSRKLKPSFQRTSHGSFSFENLRGFDLKNKTIGIVGLGHIGQYAAKIANGFGMKILAYDLHPDQELAQRLNLEYVRLEELLAQSNIITLHVPYNKHTHHLINRENIKLFKKGSLLINTARGGVVDTTALLWGLKNNLLAGAGLDVLEEEGLLKKETGLLLENLSREQMENLIEDHELLQYENVVITPHNAFNSQEALQRILDTTVKNITSFIAGNPQNTVEPK